MKANFIEVFNAPRYSHPKNAPYGKMYVNVNNILYCHTDEERTDKIFICLIDGTRILANKFNMDILL